MESSLTEVKIPGKRVRRAASGASSSTGRGPEKKRKVGRPSRADRTNLNPPSTELVLAAKSIYRRPEKLRLQDLPNEVFQRIWFFSLNFNLPKTSRLIGAKLSSEYVYRETILRVMDMQWRATAWLGAPIDQTLCDPVEQSNLFNCRWMTLERIQKAEERWLPKVAPNNQSVRCVPLTHFESYARYAPGPYIAGWNKDWDAFVRTTAPLLDGDPQLCRPSDTDGPSLGVHEHFQIPARYLTVPWTANSIKVLFWLIRAGAKIDYHGSSLGEVAMIGLQRAIEDGNLQMIHLFDHLAISTLLNSDIFDLLAVTQAPNKLDVIVRVLDILAMKEDLGPYESTDAMFDAPTYMSVWNDWIDDLTAIVRRELAKSNPPGLARKLAHKFNAKLSDHHERAVARFLEITQSEDDDEDEVEEDDEEESDNDEEGGDDEEGGEDEDEGEGEGEPEGENEPDAKGEYEDGDENE